MNSATISSVQSFPSQPYQRHSRAQPILFCVIIIWLQSIKHLHTGNMMTSGRFCATSNAINKWHAHTSQCIFQFASLLFWVIWLYCRRVTLWFLSLELCCSFPLRNCCADKQWKNASNNAYQNSDKHLIWAFFENMWNSRCCCSDSTLNHAFFSRLILSLLRHSFLAKCGLCTIVQWIRLQLIYKVMVIELFSNYLYAGKCHRTVWNEVNESHISLLVISHKPLT